MFATNGFIHIVGIGGGTLATGFFSTPFGSNVRAPYWGSRSELMEVLELAKAGSLSVHVEKFGIEDPVDAYQKLHKGEIRGRAVIAFYQTLKTKPALGPSVLRGGFVFGQFFSTGVRTRIDQA